MNLKIEKNTVTTYQGDDIKIQHDGGTFYVWIGDTLEFTIDENKAEEMAEFFSLVIKKHFHKLNQISEWSHSHFYHYSQLY